MNNTKILAVYKSLKGKYQLTCLYDGTLNSYEFEHRVNNSVQGYYSGIRTAQEMNTRLQEQLNLYASDGITLIKEN